MAISFSPFGLVGAYHPSGIDRPSQITPYRVGSRTSVSTGFDTLFKNCAIAIDAGTGLPRNTPNAAAPNASGPFIGTFLGVEYTEASSGRRIVSPYVASSTTLLDPVFYINADPNMIYEAQLATSAGAADTAANGAYIGDYVQVNANAVGNAITAGTGTGLSQAYVSLAATQPPTNGNSFQIVDHGWDNVDSALWYDATFNQFPTVRIQVAGKNFQN